MRQRLHPKSHRFRRESSFCRRLVRAVVEAAVGIVSRVRSGALNGWERIGRPFRSHGRTPVDVLVTVVLDFSIH